MASSSSSGGGTSGKKIMRLLPPFLILLLFSAALLLGYIGWVGLRMGPSVTPTRSPSIPYHSSHPLPPLIGDGDQNFDNLNQRKEPDANAPENEGLPSNLLTVNDNALRDPDLERKIELLKMKVISKLRRHILNGAKVKGHLNEYGVDFTKLKPKSQRLDRKKLLCRLKRLPLQILHPGSSSLVSNKPFPKRPLFGNNEGESFAGESLPPLTPIYKNCAIIPNSAALEESGHGIDIDSHDFIMRFNNAPVGGYEDDVGSLTTLRIVNSQVVTKPEFRFPFPPPRSTSRHRSNSRSRSTSDPNPTLVSGPGGEEKVGTETSNWNGSWTGESSGTEQRTTRRELEGMDVDKVWSSTPKFLIWDPCPYGSTLDEWIRKPDFPLLFSKYFNLTGTEPNRFYLLDCRLIWRLWEMLQEFSFVKIYGNPPTSGFIGIMLSLQVCERVNVYEYIPSVRESDRCHYYGPKNESNPSCTYGSWHPVSAEKLFFLSLSDGTDKAIFIEGVLSLPGVSTVNC